MKKLLGTLFAATLILSACSQDDTKEDESKKAESTTEKKTDDKKDKKTKENKKSKEEKKSQKNEDNKSTEVQNTQENATNEQVQSQQPGTDASMINPNEINNSNQETDKGAKFQQDQTPYQKEYTDDGHEKYNNNYSNSEINEEQSHLDSLKENGTISQSEYDEWSKQIRN